MKKMRLLARIRLAFANALDVDSERKKELSVELSKAATLRDLVYWLQLFFSAGIATLGLVLDSPAVIIGAMLISPLMGPILAAGLALATGDLILGVRAVANLILSCVAGIGFAVLLVALLPFKEMTAEIAGRTSPNTLDLFVALFSGAIGSIATCRRAKGVVTSIPGVAIAVALMPPLCVVGYGVGLAVSFNFSEGMSVAWGGGLLFLTNLFAITFTAMLVFLTLRIDTANVRQALHQWQSKDAESLFVDRFILKIPGLENARVVRNLPFRLLMVVLPLLAIIAPLSSSFAKLKSEIFQQQAENRVRRKTLEIWQTKFEKKENGDTRSFVDNISVTQSEGKTNVILRVFDNEVYSEKEKSEFAETLAKELSSPAESINFQLIEIPTFQRREKPIFEEKPKEITLAETQTNFVRRVNAALQNLPFPQNAKIVEYQTINSQTGKLTLRLLYLSVAELSDEAKDLIRQNVRQFLKMPTADTEFVRIPSERFPLAFAGNTERLTDAKELENAAAFLAQNGRLQLIVNLRKINGNGEKILEARKKALLDLISQNGRIAPERIVFNESETDSNFALKLSE